MGDIAANFLKKDDCLYQMPEKYQSVSISLERLKEISNVICVAFGLHKVDMINYVAKNRCINILITDSITATSIMEDE